MTKTRLNVEVCYVLSKDQTIIPLVVDEGETMEAAIRASSILERHPDIDLQENKTGIFGKLCELDRVLSDGDRIEIYRALTIDPKEARRIRAAEGLNSAKKP